MTIPLPPRLLQDPSILFRKVISINFCKPSFLTFSNLIPGNHTRQSLAAFRKVRVEDIDPNDDQIKVAVLSGTELKTLTSEQLKQVLKSHEEIVFARTSPEQKFTIVSAFQDLGYIVAATGDGKKFLR